MFRSLRDWIARIIAFAIPALVFGVTFAFLIRVFYLDPHAYHHLTASNRPLKSFFHWGKTETSRGLASQSDDEIAGSPGESIVGRKVARPDSTVVEAPKGSFAEIIARAPRECVALERLERLERGYLRIRAPASGGVSGRDRQSLIALYERSKRDLMGWLFTQKANLPEPLAEYMQTSLSETGMKLPPVDFEPDLAYRALAAYTRDAQGQPTIAIGSRFLNILHSDPKRAQFEMTRAMAQSWSPCEIEAKGLAGHPWTAMLKCLGVSEEAGCLAGNYSETGWAVSSTLAAYVHAPGCALPAFKDKDAIQCLGAMPLPLSMTAQKIPDSLWRVSK